MDRLKRVVTQLAGGSLEHKAGPLFLCHLVLSTLQALHIHQPIKPPDNQNATQEILYLLQVASFLGMKAPVGRRRSSVFTHL